MAESKTRANVPQPPKSKVKDFLPKDQQVATAKNLRRAKVVPMTFNMPQDWHTEFKVTAAQENITMKDLLIASFEAWKRENGRE